MLKGYKVSDAERQFKMGIAAKSLEDLRNKTRKKFEALVGDIGQFDFQLADGTKVDTEDYFSTLPSQTVLIWVEQNKSAVTDAEILYKTIRNINIQYLTVGEKVKNYLLEELKNKVHELTKILNNADTNKAMLSTRNEHPEWFEGLDTRSKTKEEYLFRRSQDRIKSYFYKAKDDLEKFNFHDRHLLLDYLKRELKRVNNFGCYFDRRCHSLGDNDELKSLCNREGTFMCQGRWDKSYCDSTPKHQINPYENRESRIVFQTWNLDHGVEKSRFIIPAILESGKDDRIDYDKVFKHLFTTDNLKLVHIVCHDKRKHTTAVSSYKVVKIGQLNDCEYAVA